MSFCRIERTAKCPSIYQYILLNVLQQFFKKPPNVLPPFGKNRQMSNRQLVRTAKCPTAECHNRDLSRPPNVPTGKYLTGKCNTGKCVNRQMSQWAKKIPLKDRPQNVTPRNENRRLACLRLVLLWCLYESHPTKDARIDGHGKYSKEPIVVRYAIISSSDWFSKFPALFTNSHVKILRTNQNWIW